MIFIIICCLLLIASCKQNNSVVIIETDFGLIGVELYEENAPITCGNFIKYLKENRFKGASFYRTVTNNNQLEDSIKIAVIQGGLYEENHPSLLPPIIHENTAQTNIKHLNGVISMARYEPGTATFEFFICIGDQPDLDYCGKRNPDGEGFAAFGKVIYGMNVVNTIHKQPEHNQYLTPKIPILVMELE
ncbi:MAG: peptidylprolyl isomerase [Lentimicrobiaceae bacterium]|nr:peptidylprolyl isomerase [Lentimicrobiaceae bacterium]